MSSIEIRANTIVLAETGTPERIRRGFVLALACASQAMVGLDIAIVNVALPSIQRDLGVGQSGLQWVVVAYGLLLGGFLLLGGRMTDQVGRRRIFLAGVAVFTGASFLAGVAQNAGLLILARAMQGFGAALITPAALSLLALTFPDGRERARSMGIFEAVGGASASVGVVAGGLLASGPGWRWSFFINLPAGAVFILLAMLFLAPDRAGDRAMRLDVTGATTVTGALLLFVYALHHAAGHGWLSRSSIPLFVAAFVLMAAFAWIEARSEAPLVPASTLKNRTLVAANATAFFATCAFLSFIFVGSLLMQQALDYSPPETGLAWLATTVTILPAAIVGARLVDRLGIRWILIVGLSLFTVASMLLARIPADASYAYHVLPAFLLAGLGFGFCGPALQIGALSGVRTADTGLAAGLVETMREIGGAIGVATVSTVLVTGSSLDGFHTGFALIGVLAIVGMVTALAGFERGARHAAH